MTDGSQNNFTVCPLAENRRNRSVHNQPDSFFEQAIIDADGTMWKHGLLTMEFRTFVNSLIRVPAQIVRTGRRLVIRLLDWNEWQRVFLKLMSRLFQRPLRF